MPPCLFCRSEEEGSFLSEEHIVPESLGNKRFILAVGVVCDKCNQYFSKLDNYFSHHHLGSGHKLLTKYKTKKGNPPSVPLKSGEMRQGKDGKIHFRQSFIKGKEHDQFSITFSGEEVFIRLKCLLNEINPLKISRFLAKAGTEILYLKKKDMAYQPEFDFVRNYARFGSRRDFVPFLWCYHKHQIIDLYISTIDSKNHGEFYFAAILLPGILYMIPLNRTKEKYTMQFIKYNLKLDGIPLNICENQSSIRREPFEIMAHLAPKKETSE